jgi:hypothetical protein
MMGFTTVVTSDQRYRLIDRDRVKAFYGALSGLEKLNTDLANLFFANVAPSSAQIEALGEAPPDIDDITFVTEGTGAYGITYVPPAAGESEYGHISTGPYAGLLALKKRYTLDATVRTTGGGEAHLGAGWKPWRFPCSSSECSPSRTSASTPAPRSTSAAGSTPTPTCTWRRTAPPP